MKIKIRNPRLAKLFFALQKIIRKIKPDPEEDKQLAAKIDDLLKSGDHGVVKLFDHE